MRTILKGLVTALVLGSAAVASAAPCNDVTVSGSVTAAPVYTVTAKAPIVVTQKPVITHPIIVVKPHASWVDLSGGIRLRGADTVAVGRQQGEFKTIELVRDGGRGDTKVQDVTITFANGQTQTICVDKILTGRDNTLQLDLAGNYRFIQSVSITGQSFDHGSIQLRAV
jgi:hypothetical protein|nr:hypothetical protein [Kofleriaceae bacterium]